MPSWDRFEALRRTSPERAEAILPSSLPTISVEAGATLGWERYADVCIGIDRFGASAPGAQAMERLGISVDHVVDAAIALVGR